jgi:hypothetical protein
MLSSKSPPRSSNQFLLTKIYFRSQNPKMTPKIVGAFIANINGRGRREETRASL